MTPPDGLLCDECGHRLDPRTGRPTRATWTFTGTDQDGRRLRLVVCESHLVDLDDVVRERRASGELVPLDGPLPPAPSRGGPWAR